MSPLVTATIVAAGLTLTSQPASAATKPLVIDNLVCLKPSASGKVSYLFGTTSAPVMTEFKASQAILKLARRTPVVALEWTLPPTILNMRQLQRKRLRFSELDPPVPAALRERIAGALKKRFGKRYRYRDSWQQLSMVNLESLLRGAIGLPGGRGQPLTDQILNVLPDNAVRVVALDSMAATVNSADSDTDWNAIFNGHLDLTECQPCKDRIIKNVGASHQAFGRGDWQTIDRLTRSRDDSLATLDNNWIDKRVPVFARRITHYLKTDQRPHFFVITFGMIGPLIESLKKSGVATRLNCHR